MKFNRIAFFLFVFQINTQDNNLRALLSYNLAQKDIASLCDIEQEIAIYKTSLDNESNYQGINKLEQWIDHYTYPVLHPAHQKLLDIIATLDISTVCDVGAGCGKTGKYVYARNPHIKLTCIEHNSCHIDQMEENFKTRTHVIVPNIRVDATIVKGCLPFLSFIESHSFNLVFTSTVMMHLPFIIAVQSALELYRISNRYILHVENKNDGNNWYNMTVVKPSGMSSMNCVGINYVTLYEKLGVKTLHYSEFKDPSSPGTFIIYLGEKVM